MITNKTWPLILLLLWASCLGPGEAADDIKVSYDDVHYALRLDDKKVSIDLHKELGHARAGRDLNPCNKKELAHYPLLVKEYFTTESEKKNIPYAIIVSVNGKTREVIRGSRFGLLLQRLPNDMLIRLAQKDRACPTK